MENINGENWSPKFKEESQNCKSKAGSGSLGTFPKPSSKYGTYEIGASREDSNESNIPVRGEWEINDIPGKVIKELVDETEKQLAYYEQQAEVLRERLKELKQIPDIPSQVDKND